MTVPLLVSTEWLSANLNNNVIVLDSTWHLGRLGRSAKSEFLASHIPGARFFDIEENSDHSTNLPHMIPPKAEFDAAVSKLGISKDSHIVVYDTYGIMASPRTYWLFQEFGHEKVSVLDGGFPKWTKEGLPTESGEPKVTPTNYVSTPLSKPTVIHLSEVKTTYTKPHNQALLIDGRPAGRFHGTVLEPRAFLPSGHIPGSVSVPALELVKDGCALPDSEMKARFEGAGVDFDNASQVIVNTCGSGVAASATFLLLKKLGVPQERLRLYDGSWTEWCWNDLPGESLGPVNEAVTKEAEAKGIYRGGPGSGA